MRPEVHVRLARSRPSGRGLIRAAALAAALTVAEIACTTDPSNGDIRVEMALEPRLATLEHPARARVSLTDRAARPIRGARLQIEGHMTHPGMAPVVARAEERSPGVYEADIRFTMAGQWMLVASGITPDGRRVTHTLDVPDVAP